MRHKQLCWALPEGVAGDQVPRPTGTQRDKAWCWVHAKDKGWREAW